VQPIFGHAVETLFKHIQKYTAISADAQAALQPCFEQVVLSKGANLLTEGKVCRNLYFVESGALRGYYTLDGKEITHWFGFETDFVTSLHSFITAAPAIENIQLLEGSILWSISKESLMALLNRYHELERLVRIVYEKYYIQLEERLVNAQFKTAAERYESLLRQSPHIIERVSLGHIASYLGISQETLSRVRNRF
jgi:CRP-like cAMP-binding protein